MKFLLTNDFHFARRNPTSRVDNYNEELFTSLDQILKLAQLTKCRAILIAGDIFHDKGQSTWAVIVRLFEWVVSAHVKGVQVLTISGNHDQTHDRYESRDSTPYGVLVRSGMFTDISRCGYRIDAGPIIHGVPWPDGSKPDAFRDLPSSVDIVMAHGFATPEGQERWGCFCHTYDDLAVQAPQVKVWHFGHDHSDHGVYVLKNGAKVVNIGALCRGALDTDSILREPKVALVDLEPGGDATVRQVTLKVPPAEQIFDLALHKQRAEERVQLEHFLEQLSTGMAGVIDVDYHATLQAMTLPDDVRSTVLEYIVRAEGLHAV